MPLMAIPDIKFIFVKKLQNKLNSNYRILHPIKRIHQQRDDGISLKSIVPKRTGKYKKTTLEKH